MKAPVGLLSDPKSTRYLAVKQTVTKKEETAMERSFCCPGKFFFSEKGLLHWLLSLCNSPFCENLFSKPTQKLVSPKLTSSA